MAIAAIAGSVPVSPPVRRAEPPSLADLSMPPDSFHALAGGPIAEPATQGGLMSLVASFWDWITHLNLRKMWDSAFGIPYKPLTPPAAPVAGPGAPPIAVPGTPPGAGPGDAIDLSKAVLMAAPAYGQPVVDFANWKADSTITNVQIDPDRKNMTVEHTMTGKWPKVGFNSHTFDENEPIEGNVWVFANINGQWYGGAGAWTYCGATRFGAPFMDGEASNYFYNFPEPLKHWAPKSGELVGIAMSTPARQGQWGTAERTNVVMVRWP